jgi:uncharacterized protein YdeI (YjbR/CyaY-like superfamily)
MPDPASEIAAFLAARTNWREERLRLRDILLDCGLDEALKWRQLAFTWEGRVVAIFYGMKAACGIGFFKGALMADPEGVLIAAGPNTQGARQFRFTSLAEIETLEPVIRTYVAEAIALEQAGAKVAFTAKHELELPAELTDAFDADPDLRAGWEALTPGRQRGYVLYFTGAKRAETRTGRVAKSAGRILAGKGLQDG